MYTWATVAYGAPLQRIELPLPDPQGSQVLVKTLYAGVCHSDLHIWKSELHDGILPCTLGHEMEGELVSIGPDVDPKTVSIGKRYLVFPWIGCGTSENKCKQCERGLENCCICGWPQKFTEGRSMYGGYASHALIPHPRYLIENSVIDRVPEGLACTYMCSGLTAFAALKKIEKLPTGPRDLLVIGCGGVGLQALQFANFIFEGFPCAMDISQEARLAAETMGCKVYDPNEENFLQRVRQETRGGFAAVFDFVGSPTTFKIATNVTASGGTIVLVGLFGGVSPLSNVDVATRSLRIQGSLTGTLDDVHEMLQAVQSGCITPIPYQIREISDVNQVFVDLESGRICGRCVLRHEDSVHSTCRTA